MNWTGGRLQRHSLGSKANAKSARAVQKQHFARARLALGSNGRAKGGSPLKIPGRGEDDLFQQRGGGPQGEDEIGEEDTHRIQGQREDHELGQGQGQDVDSIRRNLLRQTDWANLSLAKPLKMRHSPYAAHGDNLAKRRRLTDDDRRRLTPDQGEGYRGGKRVSHDAFLKTRRVERGKRRTSSSVLNSDEISIRIGDGRGGPCRGGSATPASQCRTMQMLSQASEESMLFDGEEERRPRYQVATPDGGRCLAERGSTWSVRRQRDPGHFTPDPLRGLQDDREIEREEQERLTTSTSPQDSVPLPPLDPRGSFTTHYGQTRYNPPGIVGHSGSAGTSRPPEVLIETATPSKSAVHPTQRRVPLWMPEKTNTCNSGRWEITPDHNDPEFRASLHGHPQPERYQIDQAEPIGRDHVSHANTKRHDSRNGKLPRNYYYQKENAILIGRAEVPEINSGSNQADKNVTNPSPHKTSQTRRLGFLSSTTHIVENLERKKKPTQKVPGDLVGDDAIWKRFVFGSPHEEHCPA